MEEGSRVRRGVGVRKDEGGRDQKLPCRARWNEGGGKGYAGEEIRGILPRQNGEKRVTEEDQGENGFSLPFSGSSGGRSGEGEEVLPKK